MENTLVLLFNHECNVITSKICVFKDIFRYLCSMCFRQTDDVPQVRYVWQHPGSVCHLPSTPVISPVDNMEELWMWRWACESHLYFLIQCGPSEHLAKSITI